jgi:hypothetical protein
MKVRRAGGKRAPKNGAPERYAADRELGLGNSGPRRRYPIFDRALATGPPF